jgi:hypothetical protein
LLGRNQRLDVAGAAISTSNSCGSAGFHGGGLTSQRFIQSRLGIECALSLDTPRHPLARAAGNAGVSLSDIDQSVWGRDCVDGNSREQQAQHRADHPAHHYEAGRADSRREAGTDGERESVVVSSALQDGDGDEPGAVLDAVAADGGAAVVVSGVCRCGECGVSGGVSECVAV